MSALSPPLISTSKKQKRASPDDMTLSEHLGELRLRLVICVIVFIVAAVIVAVAYEPILRFLIKPLCNVDAARQHRSSSSSLLNSNGTCSLFVTSPLDGLALRVKIAVFGGLVLASPIILFELW